MSRAFQLDGERLDWEQEEGEFGRLRLLLACQLGTGWESGRGTGRGRGEEEGAGERRSRASTG